MSLDSAKRVFIVISYLLLFLGQGLISQDQIPLRFGSITTEDGLSHSTVNSVTQDSLGFLWIATMDGLNRYDGNMVEVFRHDPDDPRSLNDNTVWKVFTSSKNEIWIGTSKGLCKFNYSTGDFINVPLLDTTYATNPIRKIIEDSEQTIWTMSTLEGLIKVEEVETDKFETSPIGDQDLAERLKNTRGHNGLTDDHTRADTLWFTHANNVLSINTRTNEIGDWSYLIDSLTYDVTFFASSYVDNNGVLWILSSSQGVYRLDIDNKSVDQFIHDPKDPKSISSNSLFRIIEDRNDNIWISSLGGGLNVLRHGEKDKFDIYKMEPTKANSLKSDNIVDLYEDRDGVIWLCTHGSGVQYFTQERDPFALHKMEQGNLVSLPSNNITSVFEDTKGHTWIGTRNEGFVKAKLDQNRTEIASMEVYDTKNPRSSKIERNTALSYLENEELGLVIGMRLGGIQVYDYEENSFRSYFYNPGDLEKIKAYHVNAIEERDNGDIYLGTFDGVYLWDDSERELIEYNHAHPGLEEIDNLYITFLKNEDDRLWMGTDQRGVLIWDKENKELFSFSEKYLEDASSSFEIILSFYEDKEGHYWIGSWDGGLLKFDTKTEAVTTYGLSHGLNNITIYSIQGDEAGKIWVSTNKGISKFDPDSERFFNFNQNDGLQGEEYNSRVGFTNPTTGHIFFGGMEGLNAFLPSQVENDDQHPDLYINRLTTFEEDANAQDKVTQINVNGDETITINHKCYLMNFLIGAPMLPKNDNVRFAYKLEGLSDNWIDLGYTQEFSLTNLATGEYTLKLRSILENGLVSDDKVMLSIISVPPWWHTWWAYLCYVVLIAAILYSIYSYRVGQLIKYQSLRTQISSDLHDDVGTILSTIAFQAEIMELEQKKSEIDGFGKLTKLSRLAMGRMRDTVWAMDARRDNTDSLLARMNDFLFDAFDHQEIEYKFDHSQAKKGVSIAPNIRQTIYLVFKESVTNALKHSTGTMIDITLTLDGKNFALKVHDNGSVDPSQMKTSGLGLSNMKARAEKVGAAFTINTTKGFSVQLEKNS